MKASLALFCAVFTSFLLPINSSIASDSATATQTIAIQIPEVNLLDIPETVYLELKVDEEGYYSGGGEFTYAITTNTPANSTKKKRISASIANANFGQQGRLVVAMTDPSILSTHTTFFQQGETGEKTLVDSISNVAKKDIALSIALEKLSLAAVNDYINPTTMNVSYPVKINYKLSYEE